MSHGPSLGSFFLQPLGGVSLAGAVRAAESQGGRVQSTAGQGAPDAAEPRRLGLRLQDGAKRRAAGAEMVSGQHQDGGEKGNLVES